MVANFFQVPATLETLHAALGDQKRHSGMSCRGVGFSDHDDHVGVDPVGDKRLRPVHHIHIAITDSRCAHTGKVRTRPRLGHRNGGDQLAGGDTRKPPLLLIGVTQLEVIRNGDVVMQRDTETCATNAGICELFGNHLIETKIVDSPTAELLRDLHAKETIGTRRGVDVTRSDPIAFPIHVVRGNLLGHP